MSIFPDLITDLQRVAGSSTLSFEIEDGGKHKSRMG